MSLLVYASIIAAVAAFTNPCKENFVPFGDECVDVWNAFAKSMSYLGSNLPSFDNVNRVTLGFLEEMEPDVEDVFYRIASHGVNISLEVKGQYPWAAAVPQDIFVEYVAPYGNVNEGRSDWRPLMLAAVEGIIASATIDDPAVVDTWTITEVVSLINSNLWSANTFGEGSKQIVFKSSQTPLIYDPMSVLAYGYASCTGVSIFLVDALRSIGIPARLAGTPAWNGVPENGNHNWLEVWTGDDDGSGAEGWYFIEAQPAGGGETLNNPCDKWYCNPSNFANGTEVFASRWSQITNTRYPMAWDLDNTEIPGVDRTAYYQSVCTAC